MFNEYAQYARLNERTLLIVDEGTILGNKLNAAKSTLLIDKLTSYTSGGDSAGRNVWFMMQSPYVTGASLNLSTTSQMTSIVIAFSENIGAIAQWKSAKIFQQLSLDEVSYLIDNSETGRAIYYGKTGRWYIMPPLTNHSGYDRDKREFLPGHEPKVEKVEKVKSEVKPIDSPDVQESDSEEKEVKTGFDFSKACVAIRTLKGRDWMKFGEARTNSKPVRKATRDMEDVRLIVLFLEKDGEAEMMGSDFFRIKDDPH